MTRRGARNRAGKSIVEVAVVLSIVSTVLLFIGKAMVGVMRTEARTSLSTLSGRTLDRLGARFRDDVRNAVGISLLFEDDRAVGVEIEGPTGVVTFRAVEGVVTRTGGGSGEAETHRETYRLGPQRAEFELLENGSTLALLVSHPAPGEDRIPRVAWRTEARPRSASTRVETTTRSEDGP